MVNNLTVHYMTDTVKKLTDVFLKMTQSIHKEIPALIWEPMDFFQ